MALRSNGFPHRDVECLSCYPDVLSLLLGCWHEGKNKQVEGQSAQRGGFRWPDVTPAITPHPVAHHAIAALLTALTSITNTGNTVLGVKLLPQSFFFRSIQQTAGMKAEQAWLLEGGTNAQAASTSYNFSLFVICDLHKEFKPE